MKHLESVQAFKNALDTMVAEGEIRAEYGNQILRLMRSGLPGYAHACGFAGGFDYVSRMGKRPSLTRREVEAQLAAAPAQTTQKKSVEHVGVDRPVIEIEAPLADLPSYTLESIAEQLEIADWDALTLSQFENLRKMAKDLGISFGPASKAVTIAQKIVDAYA
jgi:hypothetical protein